MNTTKKSAAVRSASGLPTNFAARMLYEIIRVDNTLGNSSHLS